MKNTFSTIITSSLLATSLLIASSMSAKADTLVVNLSDATNTNTQNYPTVKLTLDDTSNPGKITVKVDVVPGSTGYIGDLRGVYFNLPGVSNLQINPVSGGPLTATSTNGKFSSFSNSADLEGTQQSFNLGAEIGKQGIANGDDYQTTTFTISGTGLNLSAFTSQSVGVRMMSVGSPTGNRDLSSKTLGVAPTTVTVTNPPVVQNPTPEQPVVQNPTPEQPVVQNPTPEQPVVQNPTPEQPVVQNPTPEQPVVQNPTPEQPVVQNPTPEQPVVQNPTPEQPVVQNPSNHVSVPEPTTLAGLGLVAAALGISRYRKSNKKA